jgi:hypothetical protein
MTVCHREPGGAVNRTSAFVLALAVGSLPAGLMVAAPPDPALPPPKIDPVPKALASGRAWASAPRWPISSACPTASGCW